MSFKEVNVEKLYETDKKLKKEDVTALINWMAKQPHLPKATELQVALCLHSSYYSNEKAKNVIDAYFTTKTMCPDIFGSRTLNNKAVKTSIDCCLFTALPKLTPSGHAVMYSRVMDDNLANFVSTDQVKLFDIVILLYLHQHGPPEGFEVIFDLSASTLSHLLKVNLAVLKKFLFYFEEGLPMRLKRIHFINLNSVMDTILVLLKPFLKKEILDMFIIHSEIHTLYKYVPQEILPKECDGSAESFSNLQVMVEDQIRSAEEFLKYQENQLVDESKRQSPSRYSENLFGTEGSFKKIEID